MFEDSDLTYFLLMAEEERRRRDQQAEAEKETRPAEKQDKTK